MLETKKNHEYLLAQPEFNAKNLLPYVMSNLTFFLVASLVSTSLSIDMVDMLSDLKIASPFLKGQNIYQAYQSH